MSLLVLLTPGVASEPTSHSGGSVDESRFQHVSHLPQSRWLQYVHSTVDTIGRHGSNRLSLSKAPNTPSLLADTWTFTCSKKSSSSRRTSLITKLSPYTCACMFFFTIHEDANRPQAKWNWVCPWLDVWAARSSCMRPFIRRWTASWPHKLRYADPTEAAPTRVVAWCNNVHAWCRWTSWLFSFVSRGDMTKELAAGELRTAVRIALLGEGGLVLSAIAKRDVTSERCASPLFTSTHFTSIGRFPVVFRQLSTESFLQAFSSSTKNLISVFFAFATRPKWNRTQVDGVMDLRSIQGSSATRQIQQMCCPVSNVPNWYRFSLLVETILWCQLNQDHVSIVKFSTSIRFQCRLVHFYLFLSHSLLFVFESWKTRSFGSDVCPTICHAFRSMDICVISASV